MQAMRRSWAAAETVRGLAPRRLIRSRRRSSSVGVLGGESAVRYQLAPSNRSSRAYATPVVSAPASGCPPKKRRSRRGVVQRQLGRADVADDAVLPRHGRAPRRRSPRARPRAWRRTRLGRPRRPWRCQAPAVDRPQLERRLARCGIGVVSAHVGPARRAPQGQSSRRSARRRGPRPSRDRAECSVRLIRRR